ncbi:MAG: DUF421 domain-containing protein [Caldilineaceae bacterium]|nr:DUF421 domain-containing protein [Caldilineaceae bacterium]
MQLFQSWSEIGRIVLTGLLVYTALILYVRVAGIRSISKMNNFDWVVTVALGSTLGSVILLKDVVLLDGLAAIFTLLGAQYVVVKLSTRSERLKHLVHARPVLLFYNGHFLEEVMQRERVMQGEVLSAIRKEGHSDLSRITAVVLEPDASFSVIAQSAALDSPLFEQVKRPDMS